MSIESATDLKIFLHPVKSLLNNLAVDEAMLATFGELAESAELLVDEIDVDCELFLQDGEVLLLQTPILVPPLHLVDIVANAIRFEGIYPPHFFILYSFVTTFFFRSRNELTKNYRNFNPFSSVDHSLSTSLFPRVRISSIINCSISLKRGGS